MNEEDLNKIRKLKEEAYDLIIMIGLHEQAIAKLQEKLSYVEKQIAGQA